MLLLDKDDMLRGQFDLKKKSAIALVRKGHTFAIPMPAVGESIVMIKTKRPDSFMDIMSEFNRLLDKGFFTISYIRSAEAYGWAKALCSEVQDSRDNISPMDALIAGAAIADAGCDTLYTFDTKLLMDLKAIDDANEWRRERHMQDLQIKNLMDVISSR